MTTSAFEKERRRRVGIADASALWKFGDGRLPTLPSAFACMFFFQQARLGYSVLPGIIGTRVLRFQVLVEAKRF
jgi:hypothetical protein